MSDLKEWFTAIHEGGIFGRRTRHDLQLVELQTAQEWASAVARKFGHNVTDLRSGSPGKLPDCFGVLANAPISIELTELIDREALKGRRNGSPGWFDLSQWPLDRIIEEVSRRIAIKQAKCASQNFPLDALVVHTDEPWLQAEVVEAWIEVGGFSAANAPNIRSGWLLQSHSWTVHRIFGEL